MRFFDYIERFWNFLKKDTWSSWVVSLILIIIFIKLIFFPTLSLITNTTLPLVVVESCSMYHETSFNNWWESNQGFYEEKGIEKNEFESFPLKNGLNKGDIIFVWGRNKYSEGDIIIFNANTRYPIIHRIISENPLSTKGDHNTGQLPVEQDIEGDQIVGKAVGKIPYLGWVKLVFYDIFKASDQRGFCK